MLRLNRKIAESRSSNISSRLKDSGGWRIPTHILIGPRPRHRHAASRIRKLWNFCLWLHTGRSLARHLRWLISVVTILCHNASTADRIGDWTNLDIEFLFLQFRSSNAKWARRSLPILATSLCELCDLQAFSTNLLLHEPSSAKSTFSSLLGRALYSSSRRGNGSNARWIASPVVRSTFPRLVRTLVTTGIFSLISRPADKVGFGMIVRPQGIEEPRHSSRGVVYCASVSVCSVATAREWKGGCCCPRHWYHL